mmetsp:Transcript_53744/g.127755  ORF Transcript_53744/g.127755 Transcript_53744/m.127755 type:complete len:118 (-) Transcript_53744:145-498(-)
MAPSDTQKFVYVSCLGLTLSGVLMLVAPDFLRMLFAIPLSNSEMQCHLAPATLGWAVGKYVAASTSHASARAWCRLAGLPLLAGLGAMFLTGDWNVANALLFSCFGVGTVYFGYIRL